MAGSVFRRSAIHYALAQVAFNKPYNISMRKYITVMLDKNPTMD
jgi:hypothetical protein